MKKLSKSEKMRREFRASPNIKIAEVARMYDVHYQTAYSVKKGMEKAAEPLKKAKPWKLVHVSTSDNSIEAAMANELPITMEEPKSDPVNHPAHYKVGGIETIDFIEAKQLNYNLGNVVKYITRADHKGNRLEDLEKARWYLDREIGNLSEKLATQSI